MPEAKAVTFISKYREHQIVMTHDEKLLVNGNQIFQKGGQTLVFNNFRLTTEDPGVIAFLKGHPAFGTDIWTADFIPESAPAPEAEPATPPTVSKPASRKKIVGKPTTSEDTLDSDA